MNGIILVIAGLISFYFSFISFNKLKKEKIYKNNGIKIGDVLYSLTFIKLIWGIFYPWAFFEPSKVKYGWFLLVKSFIFFVFGLYLLYFGINYLI